MSSTQPLENQPFPLPLHVLGQKTRREQHHQVGLKSSIPKAGGGGAHAVIGLRFSATALC